jgi:ribosome-binding protein aMBF1 (putative translation factor)
MISYETTGDEENAVPPIPPEAGATAAEATVAKKKRAAPKKSGEVRQKSAPKKTPKGKPAVSAKTAKKRASPKKGSSKRGPRGNPPSKVKRAGDATYGARVARARKAKGLTQATAAGKIGCTQPGLCNVEKGTCNASEALQARIKKVLGV